MGEDNRYLGGIQKIKHLQKAKAIVIFPNKKLDYMVRNM